MSSTTKYIISALLFLWLICATNGHLDHHLTYEQKRAIIDDIKTSGVRPAWLNSNRMLDKAACQSPVCADSSPSEKATTSDIQVIFCGTGQPLDSRRGRACTTVKAGNEYLVFDIGMGAEICLSTFNNTDLSLVVANIFITHYHSDHTGGIANFLTLGWRTRGFKVNLYGPNAIIMQNFTEGMRKFYVEDALQRETNANFTTKTCAPIFHLPNEPNLSPTQFDTLVFNSVPFDPPPFDNKTRVVVYQNTTSGLVVEAFRVFHHIADPAVGYRVTYKGKVIVISGDTIGYPNSVAVFRAAKNADVLVHEILNVSYVTEVLANGPQDQFFRNCQLTLSHSSIVEVTEIAKVTNVKQIVATHIVPTPVTDAQSQLIANQIQERYSGKILVANDYDYILL